MEEYIEKALDVLDYFIRKINRRSSPLCMQLPRVLDFLIPILRLTSLLVPIEISISTML
jgi:hypothetical protein